MKGRPRGEVAVVMPGAGESVSAITGAAHAVDCGLGLQFAT